MPGLLNSQGESWKKQRQAVNPIVGKHQSILNYLFTHNSIVDDFIVHLRHTHLKEEEKQFEISQFEKHLSLLIIESRIKINIKINNLIRINFYF